MELKGIPNDVITNLNPLSLVILIPILDLFIYPAMRRFRINFTPIKKITAGYFVSCAAMIWTAVVQYYIYQRSACGWYASGRLSDGEKCPNVNISGGGRGGAGGRAGRAGGRAAGTSLE